MPEMTGYGKLSARAYTKSGDKEVYDGNLTGLPNDLFEHSLFIEYPDKNGNYSIDTANWISNPLDLPYSCTTEYHCIKCEFKWNKPKVTIIKYVISIIDGPSYNYDDSQYIITEDAEQGTIYISDYKCIKAVAYYSDNTSKTLSFDDSDNPGFNIYISYKYHKYKYNPNTENYDVIENNTLYEHLSSTQETHIGNTQKECVIFHRGDKDDIEKDEGDSYENFKIIDGITQINGIPVEH